jgi:uncharacterized phage protein gp47/JayE
MRRFRVPFDRPTLPALLDRIRSDFRSRLGITGSLLRRAVASVFAAVWAGAVHMLHGHLEWLSRQLFPRTAEREYLLQHASLYGLTPIAATFAGGTVTATGVNDSVIPADTVLVRDDGATYLVTDEAVIAGGTATLTVVATLAGVAGNMAAGETLVLETPIAGVDSTVTVVVIEGGNDEETTERFRARFELRLSEPPAGGSDQDYVGWALEVAGVTRVWGYRHENGLGTVVVRFVRDDDDDIFPSAGEVEAVQEKLDAERPTTAEVTAAAPDPLAVDMTIAVTPDTSVVRAAVEAEIGDMFRRVAEPGDGAGRGTIKLSQILVAIGVSAGVTDFTLTSPVADVVPDIGELPIVGTITWS